MANNNRDLCDVIALIRLLASAVDRLELQDNTEENVEQAARINEASDE
jgi:hypothetical protein